MAQNLPATDADALALTRACALLAAGAVIAVPTETVYGLAADARNTEALARLFTLKARPANRPFSLLLPDAGMLDTLAADLTDAARTLAHACWPGPLTLIVRARADTGLGIVPAPATLGLRVPDHPLTLALLRRSASARTCGGTPWAEKTTVAPRGTSATRSTNLKPRSRSSPMTISLWTSSCKQ